MFWLIVLIILAISFWYYYIKPLNYWTEKGVKQTKPWPILGDFWPLILRRQSFCELTRSWYNTSGNDRYIGYYQLTLPTLLIKDPQLIKQITIRDFDYFTDHRNFVNPDADPLWSGNLFSLQGQKWREMRAKLSSSFTSSKMKIIFGLMAETATNFVQYYLEKNEDLIEVELKDSFTRYTNDVIATSAFGIEVNSLKEPKNIFYLMGKEISSFAGFLGNIKIFTNIVAPKLLKYFNISTFNKEVVNYFQNFINNTIKTREEKGIVRPDMINVLLETRKGISHEENGVVDTGFATVQEFTNIAAKSTKNITDEQIASLAFGFFLAGFDTASRAMCFGTYELAVNKNIQDKLREEIMKIDKENNGKITYETLLNMKYLDMVVSEILRKWPPVTGTDRVCTKPYTIEPVQSGEQPIHLKKGDNVWFPFYGIHRNPKFYPDPDKFDPERFAPENKEKITPYTYLPFGSGPRNCIGSRFGLLEVKVVLYNLLLNFEVVPTAKTDIPLKLNRKSFANTAENGFWLGLKRIK